MHNFGGANKVYSERCANGKWKDSTVRDSATNFKQWQFIQYQHASELSLFKIPISTAN